MKISEEEVRHVAKLSKLSFSESETTTFATTFATTLSKIVDMVELLNEVDTEGVAITTTMADKKNVMRQDVAEEGTDRALLFKNVPEKENHFIKVPAILDDGGDA
ncbi:TPA: Asp-tRNA(Asn)/Glu-tRNA(Gln) amidotransferase subunit GatC [Streptococcus pyogenes]|nr:Asp-tRNA(Asn)/Glu-tRNA(Gln) amidotransferase subunit GatC [Streptococcus pyogenes]